MAGRLSMPGDDAIQLAYDCAREGLVMHDQSQLTKAGRRREIQLHGVTLAGPAQVRALMQKLRPH